MVQASILCRILLLGSWDAVGPSKLSDLCYLLIFIMEIFLLSNPRFVSRYNYATLMLNEKLSIAEEKALIQFFGDEYRTYRGRVGTKIPFVP